MGPALLLQPREDSVRSLAAPSHLSWERAQCRHSHWLLSLFPKAHLQYSRVHVLFVSGSAFLGGRGRSPLISSSPGNNSLEIFIQFACEIRHRKVK